MSRRIGAFLGAAALALPFLFVGSPQPAEANHAWGSYHWARTSNPFTLKVGDNVSSAWDAYLDEAIADWTASSVLNLTKDAGAGRPRSCRPQSGRIEVCNASYGNNGWLGLAQIWISGNHITQAVAKMNDTYFNTATYNTPAWRRLVMCQEIGHDFGLGHQDENFDNPNLGSCSDYSRDPDGPPSNEHPNQHDYDQLVLIYTHLDSSNSFSQGTSSGPGPGQGQDGGNNPSEWGTPVRHDRHGTPILYRKGLGGNDQQFTWVFWAGQRGNPNRP